MRMRQDEAIGADKLPAYQQAFVRARHHQPARLQPCQTQRRLLRRQQIILSRMAGSTVRLNFMDSCVRAARR
jgi:hypothetical protein